MRVLLRMLAVAALLAVAAAIAAVLILPGVVGGDAVRERIAVAAGNALGREVRWGALGLGLFPPAVVVEQVVVAGETAESPAWLEGERLELRVSLLPLLARTLVVDALSLRGARLNLIRTGEGIAIPSRGSAGKRAEATGSSGTGAKIDLAVAGFDLENANIVLEDRSVSPAVTWELRAVAARARGISAGEPVDLDFEFALASGGRVRGAGDATSAGFVDLEVELVEVALAPAQSYLDPGSKLAGRLSGTITASGPAADLESLRVDAKLVDGYFQIDDITIVGAVKVAADLHGSVAAPRGSFDIDATDAEVRYGGMFTKPPGDAATLRGRLVERADGSTGIDDVHFKMRNFKGTAAVRVGQRQRVVAARPPSAAK